MYRHERTERKRAERNGGRQKRQQNRKGFEARVYGCVAALFVFDHVDDVVEAESENQNHAGDRKEFERYAARRKYRCDDEHDEQRNRRDPQRVFPVVKNLQHDDDDDVCDCKQRQNRFRQTIQIASDVFDFIFKIDVRIFRRDPYIRRFVGDRNGKHDGVVPPVDFAEPRRRYRFFKI